MAFMCQRSTQIARFEQLEISIPLAICKGHAVSECQLLSEGYNLRKVPHLKNITSLFFQQVLE